MSEISTYSGLTTFALAMEETAETGSSSDATVILNVGGIKYETYVSTLKRFPGTKLGDPESLALHFRPEAGDYFFDRHPLIFATILNYYRTGVLHLQKDVCVAIVQSELEYWGIDEIAIEDCCWLGYSSQQKSNKDLDNFVVSHNSKQENLDARDIMKGRYEWFRATIWEGMEDPFSSVPAKVYTIVCVLFTVVSIFTFFAATHPGFREEIPVNNYGNLNLAHYKDLGPNWADNNHQNDLSSFSLNDDNTTDIDVPSHLYTGTTEGLFSQLTSSQNVDDFPAKKKSRAEENVTINSTVNTRPNQGLIITDYVCYAFFTLEFLIRFIFCPNKLHFVISWVMWLDLACIVPYYVELILKYANKAGSQIDVLAALRMFRIFRILRMFRFHTGLRVIAQTLWSSLREMFLMALVIGTAVLFFGSLVYYIDRSSGTFETLPDAAWWAMITMTTVGYGDIAPKSIVGRIIGSFCAMCGVLVIGFTVPIIVNNFMTFYSFMNAINKTRVSAVL